MIGLLPALALFSVQLGVDSNVLRDRAASSAAPLLRVEGSASGQAAPGLELSLSGVLEQALREAADARFTESDVEALVLYRRPLLASRRLELRLGALGEYGRTRTLFVESLVTQQGLVVLNQLGQHLLLGLRGRVGRWDLEGALQANYRWTEGLGSYHAAGMRSALSARVFIGAGAALRLRYEYQLRYLSGLDLLAPAADAHLHINRIGAGFHLQRRLFEGSALYEYARVLDDRQGSFEGDEHRAQVSGQVGLFELWQLEVSARFGHRSYPRRDPGQGLQTSDLQAGASLESRLWVWRRSIGLALRYDFSYVDAPPTDQRIVRHVALLGLIGRLEWAR